MNARRRRNFCSITAIFLNALTLSLRWDPPRIEIRGDEKNLENAPPSALKSPDEGIDPSYAPIQMFKMYMFLY